MFLIFQEQLMFLSFSKAINVFKIYEQLMFLKFLGTINLSDFRNH